MRAPGTLLSSDQLAQERDAILACAVDPATRAEHVRDAARWTWKGYRDCALGEDELNPLACKGQHWLNLTLTAVDGLDTLLLLGLDQEFDHAARLVTKQLAPQNAGDCNLFETTIRVLGGLLSASRLSQASHPELAQRFTEQAAALGARLARGLNSSTGEMRCAAAGCNLRKFYRSSKTATKARAPVLTPCPSPPPTTGAGIPFSDVNLGTGSVKGSVEMSSTSEVGTLSLEFTVLARLTGELDFETGALAVHEALTPVIATQGNLLPQYIDPKTGRASGTTTMLGARTDSYYEYLLKQWLLTGRTDDRLLHRFVDAMREVRGRLLRRTPGPKPPAPIEGETSQDEGAAPAADAVEPPAPRLLYVGEESFGNPSPKMDHLVCFLPGLLALADLHNVSTARPNTTDAPDLEVARELAHTCYQLYRRTPTGLAPEIVHFASETGPAYPGAHTEDVGGGEFYIKRLDAHSLLRPETVESLFVLWKVTGDPLYREQAWAIFRAFERWTRVEGLEQCMGADLQAAANSIVYNVTLAATTRAAAAIAEGLGAADALEAAATAAEDAVTKLNVRKVHEAQTAISMSLAAAEAAAGATVQALAAAQHSEASSDAHIRAVTAAAAAAVQQRVIGAGCSPSSRGGGYTSLESVLEVPPRRRDKMESFWLSETLKYLYLIFTEPPDRCLHPSCEGATLPLARLPLTQFVFTTEAHPLPVVGPPDDSLLHPIELPEGIMTPYRNEADSEEGSAVDDGDDGGEDESEAEGESEGYAYGEEQYGEVQDEGEVYEEPDAGHDEF